MKQITSLPLLLLASPALAAEGGGEVFFSLSNHELIVTIAFILFVGALVYFKVPGMVTGMLDRRAETIKAELEDARALREEAQSVLASYERKQKEVAVQAEHIVTHARKEAAAAAEVAKTDLQASIDRRLSAAGDQIQSAEAAAVKEVRDTAVTVAVAAARDLIAANISAADAGKLVDAAITDVEEKLH